MQPLRVVRGPWQALGPAVLLTTMVAGGCEAQHLVAGSNALPSDGSSDADMSVVGGQAGGISSTGGVVGTGGGGGLDAAASSGGSPDTGDVTQLRCPAASVTRFPVPTTLGFDPWFVAAGANEEAWFSFRPDWNTSRIGRISVAGDITAFDLPTPGTVTSLATGNQSDVWFTEAADPLGQIGHIDLLGIVTEFPVPTPGSAPDSIVLAADGNLWFVETGVTNQIGRMTPQGVFTEFPIPSVIPGVTTFAQHLAVSKGGDLALLTKENGMYIVTLDGDMTWIPMSEFGVPSGVALGLDQELYLTEEFSADLIVVDPSQPNPPPDLYFNLPDEPIAITTSPGGSLWISTGNDVLRLLSGNLTDYRPCNTEYSSGLSVTPMGAVWYSDTRGGAMTHLIP